MSDDYTTVNVWLGDNHLEMAGFARVLSEDEVAELRRVFVERYGSGVEVRVENVYPEAVVEFLAAVAAHKKATVDGLGEGAE